MVPDIAWSRMAVLAEVVAAGSITAAAERLKLTKSAVSQRLAALEAQAGQRLLRRGPRGVTLTDIGQRFHAHCARMAEEARAAVDALHDDERLRGVLRIACPSFVDPIIIPVMASFRARHPLLAFEVLASEEIVDYREQGIDVGLRIGVSGVTDLIVRRLCVLDEGLFAAPRYLRSRPRIRRPTDLAGHDWIVHTSFGVRPDLELVDAAGRTARIAIAPAMRCSSGITIRSLMLAGAGIARYPSALVRADVDAGRLARVLPGHSVPGNVLNAVYLQERYRPAKASAFLAHCSEAFRAS